MAEQGSEEQEEQRSTGTVKWFNPRKGYGFITPAEGEEEVFVHQSDIDVKGFRSLAEGADVEYTPERSSDGRLKATCVTGPDGTTVKTGSRPFAGGRGRRRVPRVAVPIQLVYPQYGLGAPGMYGGMYNSNGMGYAGNYGGAVPAQPQVQAPAQAYGAAGAPAYGQGIPMSYYSYGYPSYAVAPPTASGMVGGVQARLGPSAAERFGSQFRAVVHNLPWETSKSELFAAFSQWNPQDAHVMIDHRTGQSKGYGIVTFSSEQDLAAAIQGAHGAVIGDPGRIVSVRQDQHM